MSLKNRTQDELLKRIEEIEDFIADKGIGADKLKKAKRAQRDANIAVVLGVATVAIGLTAWAVYKS